MRRLDGPIAGAIQQQRNRPPAVEPVELIALDNDQARAVNAAIPFSDLPNPAARPFRFAGTGAALDRAIDCLAAAMLYEAGDEAVGERAVAQVVLNRLRHPAFPKTVCGVVFQGSERSTGCQFTFTCDGALARAPYPPSWDRARALARKALSGTVFARVGYSTHYHTDWVVPYWSSSLDKVAGVNTHLFFRWTGWWGTPPAFRRTVDSDEPAIARLAPLSLAHAPAGTASSSPTAGGALALVEGPLLSFGPETIGKRIGGVRLIATDADSAGDTGIVPGSGMSMAPTGFIVALDKAMAPDTYVTLAEIFCGGRRQCRIMAWMEPTGAPARFPVDPAALSTMAFSYIHDAATGLQRAMWNCRSHPRAMPGECMREREPAATAPAAAPAAGTPPPVAPTVKPERRSEQLILKPPTP